MFFIERILIGFKAEHIAPLCGCFNTNQSLLGFCWRIFTVARCWAINHVSAMLRMGIIVRFSIERAVTPQTKEEEEKSDRLKFYMIFRDIISTGSKWKSADVRSPNQRSKICSAFEQQHYMHTHDFEMDFIIMKWKRLNRNGSHDKGPHTWNAVEYSIAKMGDLKQ